MNSSTIAPGARTNAMRRTPKVGPRTTSGPQITS